MEQKEIALAFLKMVVSGKINEAYAQYVSPAFKHHNPYFVQGAAALAKGMEENHAQFPHKKFEIQHVVAEDDLVAVHSHLHFGDKNIAVVHLFRLKEQKIIELWDIGQQVPEDAKTSMF